MTTNFLGHFLVQQGVITEEQLVDAIRYQREMNKRLGEVAVERGALTEEQVRDICSRQEEDASMFGSIAVNEKHLTRGKLDELLFIQKIHYIYLGEALLLRGHITSEQYSSLMRDFYELEDDKRLNLKYVQEFFAEHKTLSSMVEAFIRAFSRCSGEAVKVGAIGGEFDVASSKLTVEIKGGVSGNRQFLSRIYLSDGVASRLESLQRILSSKNECENILEGFFELLLKYFISILREKGLFLENSQKRLIQSEPVQEDAPVVRLLAPAGVIGISLTCAELT